MNSNLEQYKKRMPEKIHMACPCTAIEFDPSKGRFIPLDLIVNLALYDWSQDEEEFVYSHCTCTENKSIEKAVQTTGSPIVYAWIPMISNLIIFD